jgi:DNA phosphorothioation-associated putative methyltransferase
MPISIVFTFYLRTLVQDLLRQRAWLSFITPATEVFDYGCGRGDDVRGLTANGVAACGWDPHYAPDIAKREADVVNLGFVINVIEHIQERIEALQGAYSLSKRVLAVAAMLVSQATQPGRPYV